MGITAKLGIRLVGSRVISDYSYFIAERPFSGMACREHEELPMTRIITFYVPASYRRTVRKQTVLTGLAKVIPFPSFARRRYSAPTSPRPTERLGVRRILRNNGIFNLIAGV